MIELCDVSLQSGGFRLQNLNWRVSTGRYCVLMGASGAGKTTILESICGLAPVKAGAIRLNGRDVTHVPPSVRRVGYVPQDLALFPTMTVRQQLEFPLTIRCWSRSTRDDRVDELAEMLQVRPLLDRRVQNLSGGEAQRVALGRALSFHPEVILLDEPLSALDETSRLRLQQLLKETQLRTGVTLIHVTHQLSEAMAVSDQITVLQNNRLVDFNGGVSSSLPAGCDEN